MKFIESESKIEVKFLQCIVELSLILYPFLAPFDVKKKPKELIGFKLSRNCLKFENAYCKLVD